MAIPLITYYTAVTIIMHDNGGGVLMEVWKGATTRVGHKNVGGGGGKEHNSCFVEEIQ